VSGDDTEEEDESRMLGLAHNLLSAGIDDLASAKG
jgi:hypothetical protein